jgi:hypothetical protein
MEDVDKQDAKRAALAQWMPSMGVAAQRRDNSAHSCYGTGAPGCRTIANPVPGGPTPLNQQPANVMTYQGGVPQNQSGEK